MAKTTFSNFPILLFLVFSCTTQQSIDIDLTSAIGEAYHKFHFEEMISEGSQAAAISQKAKSRCSFFQSRPTRLNSNKTSAVPHSVRVDRDAKIFKNLVKVVMNRTREKNYDTAHYLTKDLLETALEEDATLISLLESYGGPLLTLRPRGKIYCDPNHRYRSPDGSCNSPLVAEYGSQARPFTRMLKPHYEDGHDSPRGGKCPSSLPNPRLVSSTVHPDRDVSNSQVTNMVMQFGQFLAHDISAIAETEPHQDCCSHRCSASTDCFEILIPSGDHFYSGLSNPQTCLPFSRSASTITTQPEREQFNVNTGFLDAGMVYGSTPVTLNLLRSFSGGELIWNRRDRNFLPTVEDVYPGDLEDFPELPDHPDPVFPGEFFAGDLRVNDMPGLSSLHTLWFREHNRLAGQIKRRLPKSLQSDELIFQEARRLLTSVWQNVIYNEHLPVILGPELMDKYKLDVSTGYSHYDPSFIYQQQNLIINAFSTAAYRFGHTLVQGLFHLYAGGYHFDSYNFFEHFFDSANVTMINYNFIMEGLINQPAQHNDEFVTEGLSNFLFKETDNNFGEDLLSRNLQRGRDHGLPPYHRYRILAGLSPLPATFTHSNNPPELTRAAWSKLSQVYSSPQQIDLFSGGLSEIGVSGGQMGPTFGAIVAQQFRILKLTDRFFFTHANWESSPWGEEALREIRGHALANVICDNTDVAATANWVQMMPTHGVNSQNPVKPCSLRRGMDLDIIVKDILKSVDP